jgi:hypothetical protein
MRKRKKPPSPAEQSARFIEAARKLGADERPEEFDKAFKKIASQKKENKPV